MRAAAREQRGRHHAGDDAQLRPVVGHVTQLIGQLLGPPLAVAQPPLEHPGHLTNLAGESEAHLEERALFRHLGGPVHANTRRPDHIFVECHAIAPLGHKGQLVSAKERR
jgi:hypothetical protein